MALPKYDKSKMKRLCEKDRYVGFISKDLQSRGHSEDEALKVVYNQILEGNETAMIEAYKKA